MRISLKFVLIFQPIPSDLRCLKYPPGFLVFVLVVDNNDIQPTDKLYQTNYFCFPGLTLRFPISLSILDLESLLGGFSRGVQLLKYSRSKKGPSTRGRSSSLTKQATSGETRSSKGRTGHPPDQPNQRNQPWGSMGW